MRVTTAATLAVGVAIGFLFGVGTDADTKERIARAVKEKIFYAITGEEMLVRNWKPKPTNKVSYQSFSNKPQGTAPIRDWREFNSKLVFDDYDGAAEFIKEMLDLANNCKCVTCSDAAIAHNLKIDYRIGPAYGWEAKDIRDWEICEIKRNSILLGHHIGQYIVNVNEPKNLLEY